MSKTINIIDVVSRQMRREDTLPVPPLTWFTLKTFGTHPDSGQPALSASLASDAEIDETVAALKADLDRAAREAKAALKRGHEAIAKYRPSDPA